MGIRKCTIPFLPGKISLTSFWLLINLHKLFFISLTKSDIGMTGFNPIKA
jgi:hypothetical protein